jgi:site-specific DNA recombinase
MRTALYLRVSTDEQAERYGLSSQLTELRALAAKKGWTVSEGGEFVDDGYSGAELDRPALSRLREAIRAGKYDVILIHDPDRLSRRLAHQLLLTEEIERAGVRVEFLTTPREDSAEGRLLLHVKGVLGEYEREKIKERTLRGKRAKARAGLLPTGPIPFGYRQDPKQPGRLVVFEDEAAVIRQIFGWLLEDQRSVRKIAEALDRAGRPAPRGGHWAPSTVKRLLQSEVYVGRMWFNRREWSGTARRLRPEQDWIQIPVPAIVPEWMLAQARAQLTRNQMLFAGRPSPRFYLLRGLLMCGACGRRWHSWPSHGRRRYRCTSRNRFFYLASCGSPSRRADELERVVWETVTGILRNPTLLAQKIEAHRTTLGVRDVEIQSEAVYLERRLGELDRQERKLLELYLGDAMASPVLRAKIEEIAAFRKAAKDRWDAVRARLAQDQAEAARQDGIARYCALALQGLDGLTPQGRRQLLLALVDRVVVTGQTLEIHGVLPGRDPGGNRPESHHERGDHRLRP